MAKRFIDNPIITTHDIIPSQANFVVEGVMNPSVFTFNGKIWLLMRVAERPVQKNGFVSIPVMNEDGGFKIIEFEKEDPEIDLSDSRFIQYSDKTYLSTISHLQLVCSDDGVHFYKPEGHDPIKIFGMGNLETFGIEDCRVTLIDGVFNLTYTQVSEHGVGVGLMRTSNWQDFAREGMILPPHNKDCAIFEGKIGKKYYCLHRPSGVDVGGNFIWIATSENLTHWGNHQCVLHTRKGMWDSERVGAGATPIKTKEGWLAIYHGSDKNDRYCLGAVLLDLQNPSKVLARSHQPLLEPTAEYEKNGFFNNVVFSNGHLVNGDNIILYYGASDQVICGAELSIGRILSGLKRID